MKNRNIIFKIAAMLMLCIITCTSCDEKLISGEESTSAPAITDFSPKSGNLGTEIKITGENLLQVNSVTIGGEEATIKYRINAKEVVVVVNEKSKTGKLSVANPYGKAETNDVFTISYTTPAFDMGTLPTKGKVGEQMLIEGTNLDAVIEIFFGTVKAEIVSKTATDIMVKIPYFEEVAVDISLTYNNQSGVQTVGTTNKPFSLEKPEPAIEAFPASGEKGETITLTGVNLKTIEKVMFDDYEAAISLQTETSISATVPSKYVAANSNVKLKLIYYGDKELIVTSAFEVQIPPTNYWPEVTIFANDVTTTNNFFDAAKGKIYTPCNYPGNEENTYFYLTITSSSLAFNNPLNGINQIKAFKCNNESLPASVDGALNVKFRRLDPTNEADNLFVEKVKNKTLTSLSQADIDLAGVVRAGTSSLRHDGVAGSNNNVYAEGDVILFQRIDSDVVSNNTAPIISVGLFEITKITTTNPKSDKTSSITFNCYFQR